MATMRPNVTVTFGARPTWLGRIFWRWYVMAESGVENTGVMIGRGRAYRHANELAAPFIASLSIASVTDALNRLEAAVRTAPRGERGDDWAIETTDSLVHFVSPAGDRAAMTLPSGPITRRAVKATVKAINESR